MRSSQASLPARAALGLGLWAPLGQPDHHRARIITHLTNKDRTDRAGPAAVARQQASECAACARGLVARKRRPASLQPAARRGPPGAPPTKPQPHNISQDFYGFLPPLLPHPACPPPRPAPPPRTLSHSGESPQREKHSGQARAEPTVDRRWSDQRPARAIHEDEPPRCFHSIYLKNLHRARFRKIDSANGGKTFFCRHWSVLEWYR